MSAKVKRILADSYVHPSPCEHDPVIDHRE